MQERLDPTTGQPTAAKRTRTLIRLKNPLKEGEEIHAVLPDTLAELEEALARGELKEVKARI